MQTKTMKATIYTRSEFLGNVVKIEVKALGHQRRAYAQYASAVEVEFLQPRQRSPRAFVQAYRPSVLILEGWGHPDPAAAFGQEEPGAGGVSVSRSRYGSCDERWQGDFNAMIDAYIAEGKARVVADYRGVNTHEPLPA